MRKAAREYLNQNNGSREGMSSNSMVAEPAHHKKATGRNKCETGAKD
ncbi:MULTISPECIES: hypothetical protein [unclassified Bradyrhizobium]|nr:MULTISPECIES: hypothetical protein [unclassified Bradyrhizobium]WGR70082.1 hypothetical protein MTX24_32550 [Bradyrhizobium sp. ISRA426]WGR82139.1 hypothetical protein MTX21_17655 [Bradyrhizobium sp. ISRA430]WGR85325.1 hypothetical protein MTX25_32225 [Bradyrhizobium sp. ISRA432]